MQSMEIDGNEQQNSDDLGADESEDEHDDHNGFTSNKKKEVYLPHKPLKRNEELVCDQSAYVMLREVQTGKNHY